MTCWHALEVSHLRPWLKKESTNPTLINARISRKICTKAVVLEPNTLDSYCIYDNKYKIQQHIHDWKCLIGFNSPYSDQYSRPSRVQRQEEMDSRGFCRGARWYPIIGRYKKLRHQINRIVCHSIYFPHFFFCRLLF